MSPPVFLCQASSIPTSMAEVREIAVISFPFHFRLSQFTFLDEET